MSETAVRPAVKADTAAAAQALGSAFSIDPMFQWIVGSGGPVGDRVRHMFKALVAAEVRKPEHLVFVSNDVAGVAVWKNIDAWKTPTWQMLPVLPSLLRGLGTGVLRGMRVDEAMEKQHPEAPHYYLAILGTRADSQSKGIGSALLQPMLERCDAEGVPAYLESSNPRNVPFYARHGFEETELIEVPAGAPPLQAMWRDPR